MKVLAAFLCGALLVGAETRQEQGKRIVDEAIKVLGGDAFLSMKDRVETGRAYSFYREHLTGLSRAKIYTRYLTGPGTEEKLAQRERQSFGKDEDAVVLFIDDGAYQLTFRGAKPLEADRLARYKESTFRNFFYMMRTRRNEPGLVYDYMGSEIVDNIPTDAVDITDSENRTTTVYFQKSTKLPIRQRYVRRDPETKDKIEEVSIFAKYRESGGIQWPWHILRERNGEKVFEIYAEDVQFNQGLTDDLFTLPANLPTITKTPTKLPTRKKGDPSKN
jgi:hypothetical protein